MGKPLAEARAEIRYAASFVETVPSHRDDTRILVLERPMGVVAAIIPWNFPAAMVTRKIAPAPAAGCPVVLKPAAETPLTALALAVLAERAGLPPGLLNVVTTTDGPSFGETVCSSDVVRKLTFTGSTATGRKLMAPASPKVLRLSLELGGNAQFIVFDDADLDAAVEGAMQSKFRNAGQTCVCANRILVQDGLHDAFVDRLAECMADLRVGPGAAQGAEIGPLISEAAVAKMEAHVADAIRHGARLVRGGGRHPSGGTFVAPAVLADVSPHALVAREETFAPLAPVFRFHGEAEAVRMANNTVFGLAAYFYGRDLGRVTRVAEALEYGIVGVNTGSVSTEVAPFGGIKQSGCGREGSRHGIEGYLSLKYVCLGGIEAMPA